MTSSHGDSASPALHQLCAPVTPRASISDGDAVVRFLRDLRGPWSWAARGKRAALVASIDDRVIVNDREVVEVELTDDAERDGLAWALPEQVKVVLARPAGARRRQTTIVRVPIHGGAEWHRKTSKGADS